MNKDDMQDIRKQVVAGVIIFILTAAIKYFWDKVITRVEYNFFDWFNKSAYIKNWILLLLTAFFIFVVFERIKWWLSIKSQQAATFSKKELPKRLEAIEEKILTYLSKREGQVVGFEGLKSDFLDVSETKLRYYLEHLSRNYFIKIDLIHGYLSLDHKGRTYLVKNNLI